MSIIISSRNEFPNIVHTVHSIINDLATFLSDDEWEIILVDNGSDDDRSWRFLAERGMYYHRNIRILHDPIMGNVSARDKGVALSNAEYIFFSDAHMSYQIGSFERMIQTIDETGGIVHPAVQWMGGYNPATPSLQYTLKIGEKLWGTWNNYKPNTDEWFYIPVSGHCCLGMRRKQYIEYGGYNKYFRCYGGGELYLDLKWWMLGSTVVVEPRAVGYHLSAGRGYSYYQDDFIHNIMLMAWALGARALGERVYIMYLNKEGVNVGKLRALYNDAIHEAREDEEFMSTQRVSDLYTVLATRPWDKMNTELYGSASSGMLVFQDTWVKNLTAEAKELYETSPLQKELNQFIDKNLQEYIYKP